MKTLYETITAEAKNLAPEAVRIRRDLHAHPEEGWMEYYASALVASHLEALGLEVLVGDAVTASPRMGLPTVARLDAAYDRALKAGADARWLRAMKGGKTGVVGILRGGEGPVVALRFDLDALPLAESDADDHVPVREGFASTWQGTMHACGHDGHTAIGLGVAKLLATHRTQLRGTVKFLFQPAEEGVRGADAMWTCYWAPISKAMPPLTANSFQTPAAPLPPPSWMCIYMAALLTLVVLRKKGTTLCAVWQPSFKGFTAFHAIAPAPPA